jgi:Skp family chaperone for outer membrane proteins
MRNRVFTLIALLGLATLPIVAWGQTPAVAGTKIGVVNFQGAIGSTAEGKKAVQELQKKYETRTRELQQQQQEIQSLQDQLQKGAATLSDDEQRRLARELEDKQKRFKRGQEDYQADIQAEQQEIVQRLGLKMFRLVNEYGQQNGFALIMEGYPQVPIYFAPIDVTEEMIKRYDAAYPIEAAAATPGASTAPAATKPATPTPKPPVATKPADKPKP